MLKVYFVQMEGSKLSPPKPKGGLPAFPKNNPVRGYEAVLCGVEEYFNQCLRTWEADAHHKGTAFPEILIIPVRPTPIQQTSGLTDPGSLKKTWLDQHSTGYSVDRKRWAVAAGRRFECYLNPDYQAKLLQRYENEIRAQDNTQAQLQANSRGIIQTELSVYKTNREKGNEFYGFFSQPEYKSKTVKLEAVNFLMHLLENKTAYSFNNNVIQEDVRKALNDKTLHHIVQRLIWDDHFSKALGQTINTVDDMMNYHQAIISQSRGRSFNPGAASSSGSG